MITNIIQTNKTIKDLSLVIEKIEADWDISFDKVHIQKIDTPLSILESEEASDVKQVVIAENMQASFMIIFEAE